jgi:hypothetical protein
MGAFRDLTVKHESVRQDGQAVTLYCARHSAAWGWPDGAMPQPGERARNHLHVASIGGTDRHHVDLYADDFPAAVSLLNRLHDGHFGMNEWRKGQ